MKNNNQVFNATMSEDIILRPLVSEKSYDNIALNKYSFEVKKDANKYQIKQAVEKLFEVEVIKINTLNYKGKPKRVGKHDGYKNDWKKAIVTLKDGQTIKFFESVQ